MLSPASDLYDLITLAGVAGGTTGWEMRVGHLPDTPDQIIVLADVSGEMPWTTVLMDQPRVSVRVRGAPLDYDGAYQKMAQLYLLLHGLERDLYPTCVAVQNPYFADYDDQERPTFTNTYKLTRTPP